MRSLRGLRGWPLYDKGSREPAEPLREPGLLRRRLASALARFRVLALADLGAALGLRLLPNLGDTASSGSETMVSVSKPSGTRPVPSASASSILALSSSVFLCRHRAAQHFLMCSEDVCVTASALVHEHSCGEAADIRAPKSNNNRRPHPVFFRLSLPASCCSSR